MFILGGEGGSWYERGKKSIFSLLEGKENNMRSRLSFICILFFLMLVNLIYYNGASVFYNGSYLLSRWYMVLFWATRTLVNVFFPVCHRRHHWECTTEDLRIDSYEELPVMFLWAIFFPLVLEFLFNKSCFFLTYLPFFRVIYKIVLSSRKEFLWFIPYAFPTGTDIFWQ